jgi:MFS superfamily sulfate permease-like transporter
MHGIVALVLPPIAPVFAWQRGARILAGLWGLFAALYIVSFLAAR